MSIGLSEQGGDQVAAALLATARALDDETSPEPARILATQIQQHAPVVTGRLVRSTTATGSAVTIAAPYARTVNARNPYISRGLEAAVPQVLSHYSQQIATHLEGA